MASTHTSTIATTDFLVVTTRDVVARAFDTMEAAVRFQTRNPTWRIMEREVTLKDVTPPMIQGICSLVKDAA